MCPRKLTEPTVHSQALPLSGRTGRDHGCHGLTKTFLCPFSQMLGAAGLVAALLLAASQTGVPVAVRAKCGARLCAETALRPPAGRLRSPAFAGAPRAYGDYGLLLWGARAARSGARAPACCGEAPDMAARQLWSSPSPFFSFRTHGRPRRWGAPPAYRIAEDGLVARRNACAGMPEAERSTISSAMNASEDAQRGAGLGESGVEVRVATPEEMTTLMLKGERLPNLLQPLALLCAGVLYRADYLQSAVAADFQRRYGACANWGFAPVKIFFYNNFLGNLNKAEIFISHEYKAY